MYYVVWLYMFFLFMSHLFGLFNAFSFLKGKSWKYYNILDYK